MIKERSVCRENNKNFARGGKNKIIKYDENGIYEGRRCREYNYVTQLSALLCNYSAFLSKRCTYI